MATWPNPTGGRCGLERRFPFQSASTRRAYSDRRHRRTSAHRRCRQSLVEFLAPRTLRLVFGAFFFVLLGFAVSAQQFAAGIDCDPNLLAVLIDHGFIVGALFFPT